MMSVPLEGPWPPGSPPLESAWPGGVVSRESAWPAGGVAFEPEWPLGAFYGLAVFGVDTYGVTVIPALEAPLVSWGVTLEPPW